MASFNPSNIYTFIKWATQAYLSLERQTLPYPCKVISINFQYEVPSIEIQFTGLTNIIELSCDEIIENNYFEYFSSEDKKQIFNLAYNKNILKLTNRFTCQQTGNEMVILINQITGNEVTLDLNDLPKNESIMQFINPIDTYKIGLFSNMKYMNGILNFFKNL